MRPLQLLALILLLGCQKPTNADAPLDEPGAAPSDAEPSLPRRPGETVGFAPGVGFVADAGAEEAAVEAGSTDVAEESGDAALDAAEVPYGPLAAAETLGVSTLFPGAKRWDLGTRVTRVSADGGHVFGLFAEYKPGAKWPVPHTIEGGFDLDVADGLLRRSSFRTMRASLATGPIEATRTFHWMNLARLGGEVVLAGASAGFSFVDHGSVENRNAFLRWKPETDVDTGLSTIESASLGREGAVVVSGGSRLMVVGGAWVARSRPGLGCPTVTYSTATDGWLDAAGWHPLKVSLGFRNGVTGAWTGERLLVFGGATEANIVDSCLPLGPVTGIYADPQAWDPTTDTWTKLPTVGAPSARFRAVSVWTGSEFLVFGGRNMHRETLADAAAYSPASATWRSLATGAPANVCAALWLGAKALVSDWSGNASLFDPKANVWSPLGPAYAPVLKQLCEGTTAFGGGVFAVADGQAVYTFASPW